MWLKFKRGREAPLSPHGHGGVLQPACPALPGPLQPGFSRGLQPGGGSGIRQEQPSRAAAGISCVFPRKGLFLPLYFALCGRVTNADHSEGRRRPLLTSLRAQARGALATLVSTPGTRSVKPPDGLSWAAGLGLEGAGPVTPTPETVSPGSNSTGGSQK